MALLSVEELRSQFGFAEKHFDPVGELIQQGGKTAELSPPALLGS